MALSGILYSNAINSGSDAEVMVPFVAPLTIKSNQPAYVQDTLNLKRLAGAQGVQRWEITANLMPSVGDADFLVHTIFNGYDKAFYLRMPQVHGLNTTKTSITLKLNPLTGLATKAGDKLIHINQNTALVPGEFINIGSDPKVYMVRTPGANGNNIEISPPLRIDTVVGAVVKTDTKVTMQASYDISTNLGIVYVDGVLSDPGSVTFIEVL